MATILAGIACIDCKAEPTRGSLETRKGAVGWRFEKRRTPEGFTVERRCPGCWEAHEKDSHVSAWSR